MDELDRAIELFEELCELDRNAQLLRLETISDPQVRADVEAMLEGDRIKDDRLEGPVVIPPDLLLTGRDGENVGEAQRVLERLSARVQSFAHYRVDGELGKGGMGTVLEVWDEDLERKLAMKVMSEESKLFDDRRALARLLEEARTTGKLDHPGIVPVHELGVDPEGRLFFTMRLVHGQTLESVFDLVAVGKDDWSQTRALGVLLRVCEALAYAHSKGIVHRDLKPANVMVGRFGEVYVMDWGVAWTREEEARGDPSSNRTGSSAAEGGAPSQRVSGTRPDGDVVGTPYYMSPEQAAGLAVDARSDVYALGALLYRLLASRPPYAGSDRAASPRTVLEAVRAGPPASIQTVGLAAPPEACAICEKAMARDPADRYADTGALANDLRAYLEQRVVLAYESGAFAELRKWFQRNRALAWTISAAIVALAGALLLVSILKFESDRNARDAREQEVKALAAAESNRAISEYLKQVTAEVSRAGIEFLPSPEILERLGLLEIASEQLERLIELQESSTEIDHASLSRRKMELAGMLSARGRTDEAERKMQAAQERHLVSALRLVPHEELRFSHERETRVTMAAASTLIPLRLHYRQTVRLTVGPSSDHGSRLQFDLHFGDLHGTFESPGSTIEFDSNQKREYPPFCDPMLVPILESVGHSIRVSVSEYGRVESVQGWESIFAAVDARRKSILDLSDENVLRSIQVYFALLPEMPEAPSKSWETVYPFGFGDQIVLFRPMAVLKDVRANSASWVFGTQLSAEGMPRPILDPTEWEAENPRWAVDSATLTGGSLYGTTEVSRADGFLEHQRVEVVLELEQVHSSGTSTRTTAVEWVELRRE